MVIYGCLCLSFWRFYTDSFRLTGNVFQLKKLNKRNFNDIGLVRAVN